MAAGFAEAAPAPLAAGLAATGVLFVVAVASAAFFLVGIVAFRSVVAAAFAAAVLLELFAATETALAAFGAGLAAALVGGALVLAVGAPALAFGAGFAATALLAVAGDALGAFAVAALAFVPLAVVLGAIGLVAVRAFAVAGPFAAGRAAVAFFVAAGLARAADDVERVALARLTEAAGWVAVRAAALDAAAGLAVRPVVATDLVAFAAALAGFMVLAEFDLGFAATIFVATGLAGTAIAVLRTRAAVLVLGDISATPEIGRPPRCVIDDDVPRGRQGT